MRTLILALAAVLFGTLTAFGNEADLKLCADEKSPDATACTRLIEDGAMQPQARATAHVHRGETLRAKGDNAGALADYDEAIRRSPTDGRFWHARALVHLARGDNVRALADLDRLVELAPNYAKGLTDRAKVHRAMGNTKAAQADEERARNVPRNWPNATEFTLFLFLGLLISWTKIAIAIAVALLIRRRWPSLAVVTVLGMAEGVFGSRLELIDIYFTREGWAALNPYVAVTAGLSALASIAWWGIGRALRAMIRYGGPSTPREPAPVR